VNGLLRASRVIDAINSRIGKAVAWLILCVVIVSATNATVRKVFDTSSNAWLELQWTLFGVVFLLCSPWTLLSNEHVRIDIVNNLLPKKLRDAIDIFGHVVCLLPLSVIMGGMSVPFLERSFALNEQSLNAGGLPQWPAKSLLVIGFALLFLQGVSELIKRIAILRGLIPDPGVPQHAVEAEVERVLSVVRTEPQ